MPTPQTYQSHARFHTLFHFFLIPLLLLNFIVSFVLLARQLHQHPYLALWWVVLSFLFIAMTAHTRIDSLKVQDRVIRLEERLRLAALLPSSEHALIPSLTTSQLIALRFASDDELPALARRAHTETLTSKQIKQAIVTWHPDHHRV